VTKSGAVYEISKRSFDVLAAVIGIVALSPVLGVVALLVRWKLGPPVIFHQMRPGLHAKPFNLYKFRTMLPVDERLNQITNEQRMTPFGKKLRALSLDELPSLWCVLKGDMSIIGPRPLRMEYLQRYNERQARRHEVKPGITGLAQVSGRNALPWEDRLELDVQYVEQRSWQLDLQVLCTTFSTLIRRDGITGDGLEAMSAFMGSEVDNEVTLVDLTEAHLQLRTDWLSDPIIREGVSISFEPDLASMHAWFARVKADRTRRDWVAMDASGAPLGMVGLHGVGTSALELYIYLNPMLIGQGFGSKVMAALEKRALSLGAHELILETQTSNARALRFYSRLGFREFDRNGLQENKVAMRKELLV